MTKKKETELEQYTQELWDTIMRIIHGFRTGIAGDEDIELTFPQIMLLIELQRTGTCSMGELSHRLGITQGVATRMVDRLLERGMVERERDAEDRRVVRVTPTKKGSGIARDIEKLNRDKNPQAGPKALLPEPLRTAQREKDGDPPQEESASEGAPSPYGEHPLGDGSQLLCQKRLAFRGGEEMPGEGELSDP